MVQLPVTCTLGIGPDGHIAFNEPGSSLSSRTRIKSLAVDTILANARFFDNDITQVPKAALTVGVGTVMDAREVSPCHYCYYQFSITGCQNSNMVTLIAIATIVMATTLVSVATIDNVLQVMIIITGAHKSFALYKAIEEGISHMWTVSAFQSHPHCSIVCDEDATLELRVKTVKYFKGLMDMHNQLVRDLDINDTD